MAKNYTKNASFWSTEKCKGLNWSIFTVHCFHNSIENHKNFSNHLPHQGSKKKNDKLAFIQIVLCPRLADHPLSPDRPLIEHKHKRILPPRIFAFRAALWSVFMGFILPKHPKRISGRTCLMETHPKLFRCNEGQGPSCREETLCNHNQTFGSGMTHSHNVGGGGSEREPKLNNDIRTQTPRGLISLRLDRKVHMGNAGVTFTQFTALWQH